MYSLLTLGRLSLERDGEALPGFDAQRRGLALLSILAVEGSVSRDRVMALLWPDSDADRARGSLKQALHQLRQFLGTPGVIRGSAILSLDPSEIECDVTRFIAAHGAGDLAGAVALYAGPFLDGVHLGGSAEFEAWVEEWRTALARLWRSALEGLAERAEAEGDPQAAVDHWRRLQGADPADSRVALRLMGALESAGRRAAALGHAREHQRLLREEWGLAPDPSVEEMAERLRSAPPQVLPLPTRLPAAPPQAPVGDRPASGAPRVRPGWRLAAAVVLTLVVVGVVRGLRTAAEDPAPERQPNLVAVAPFQALDPSLELWREGLADLLARDIDGAGPLRTVAGAVAFRNWPGRYDRAAADELGRRTGAGVVLYGSVARLGGDTVALRVSVLDRSAGGLDRDFEVRGSEQRMGRLADSLVVRILRELGRERPIASAPRVSLGARSLPALRAFLRAEQFYRRNEWDSAVVHYGVAVEEDPDFAIALRRLAIVLGWGPANRADYLPPGTYRRRAITLIRNLALRDSLVLLADSHLLAGARDAEGLLRDKFARIAALEEAGRRYPGDPDVWYEVGEGRYHSSPPLGGPAGRTLEAFDRAIALDPGFGPAYEHAVELALQLGDSARAAGYAHSGGHLARSIEASSLRLVAMVLDSGIQARRVREALAGASPNALLRLSDHLRWATDSAESLVAVLEELQQRESGGAALPPVAGDASLRPSHLATSLAFRGHLRAAARLVTSGNPQPVSAHHRAMVDPFPDLALLGAIPDSIAEAAFRRGLDRDADWGGIALHAVPRYLRGAPWWLARGDTVALRQLADRARRAARHDTTPVASLRGRYYEGAATAYLTLARGDSLGAERQLLAISDSLCVVAACVVEKGLLARLLAARGEYRRAVSILDRWGPAPAGNASGGPVANYPSAVLGALDRARIAERLGDRAMARSQYRFVAEVWRNADPELQPYVAEARAGLARMERPPR